MQCAYDIYIDMMIKQHINAIKMLRKMNLMGKPLATHKNQPEAKTENDYELLDADYEIYDEIQDMAINDVINGYMDEEMIIGFVECEQVDNDLLYDVATTNEIVNIEPITRKIKIKRSKPKKVDNKIVCTKSKNKKDNLCAKTKKANFLYINEGTETCTNISLPDDNLITNAKKRKNQVENVKCIKFDTSIDFDFTKYCVDKRGEMYYQDNGKIYSVQISKGSMYLREYYGKQIDGKKLRIDNKKLLRK